MADKLLEVKNLRTEFKRDKTMVTAVSDISFTIHKGEVLGLLGESGCGKSVTSLSIMGLLTDTPGKVTNGEVLFKGKDLLKASDREMRNIRGSKMSMIFQEPMSSLNPCMRIEAQLIEAIRLHNSMNRQEARKHSIDMLKSVGIPDPETTLKSFPHQLSGDLFANPTHPYTRGLIASVPKLGSKVTSLPSIPGNVPDLSAMPKGCKFAPRCKYVLDICKSKEPN